MTDEEYIARLVECEQRAKSNTRRLDSVEESQKALNELAMSVHDLAASHDHLKTDVGEIKVNVKALIEKPAKRWDGLVDKAIAAAVGAFLAWLASGAPGL